MWQILPIQIRSALSFPNSSMDFCASLVTFVLKAAAMPRSAVISVFEERSFPYARIVRDDKDNINKVVEEVDASDKEFLINELFCSHYLFKSEILREYLPLIKKNINTREINLTEIINKLILNDKIINVISVDDWNRLVGLNTFEDIKWAESQKIK